MEYAKL